MEEDFILNLALPPHKPAQEVAPKTQAKREERKEEQKQDKKPEKQKYKKEDQKQEHKKPNERKSYRKKVILPENQEEIMAQVLGSDEEEVEGRDVFSGELFSEMGLHPRLERALAKLKLSQVTGVQRSSIPACLRFDNVLLKAETGSGKTLAYLVPAIHRILTDFDSEGKRISRELGPLLLILAPTHELCLQIDAQLTELLQRGNMAFLVSSCLMGGERVKREKDRLRKGVNILVATPGRLLYHFANTSSLGSLHYLKHLVLDESDRLLDMGFERELKQCLQHLRQKCEPVRNREDKLKPLRVTLVSATLDLKIRRLLNELMDSFKPVGFSSTSIKRLKHGTSDQKQDDNQEQQSATIELSSKDFRECEDSKQENQNNLLVGGEIFKLHGKMAHVERVAHFRGFNKSKEGVLFATGVASRGLDFQSVDWVLHFDLQPELKAYINRVGRTARLNRKGKSLAFILFSQKNYKSHMAKQGVQLKELSRQKLLIKLSKGIRQIWEDGRGSRRFRKKEDQDQEMEKEFEVLSYMRAMVKDKMKEQEGLATKAKLAVRSSISALGMARARYSQIFRVKSLNLTKFERGMGLDRETAQSLRPKAEKSGGGHISAAEVKKVMKKAERMERAIKNTRVADVLAREFA